MSHHAPGPAAAAFDASALHAALVGATGPYRQVEVKASTGSTNADAAALARAGAPGGSIVVTADQTRGRGRLDRSFEITAGRGLAVSVLLRPPAEAARWVWLPLLTGLAVADTLQGLGLDPALKWPNDALVSGRKIAGILVERVETDEGPAAVVGIGLNVDLTEEDLPVPTATSLRIEGARHGDLTRITVLLLRHLARHVATWESGADLREAYQRRCDTIGRVVDVSLPDGSTLSGTADGIDDLGRLVVDGTAISAGDVTHVRPRDANI